jgi:hypothetical protein
MINLKWKITEGKWKGVTLFDHCSCTPQALWKLKGLLEAVGVDAEEDDKAAEEYAEELTGQSCTIFVVNETFEGEQRPKVTSYGGVSPGEEEEEEAPKKKKGAVKDDDEEEEEEEEDEDESPKKGSAKKGKVKEGSRVKFDDDGKTVRGTVTSLDDGKATVEDKNGDEYEIDAEDLTLL